MGIVMWKKGVGLADITEVSPTCFMTDLISGTRESLSTEDNLWVLSLATKKLMMPSRDKANGGGAGLEKINK